MRSVLRAALVAPSLVLPFVMTAPAAAADGVAFEGTVTIGCFGCSGTTGVADLTVTGLVGSAVVAGRASASFSADRGPGVSCVTGGQASGTVAGAINVTFIWNRVGAFAVITTRGDIDGSGVAALVVTSPVGIACGGPMSARVTGTIGGA